ncbi:MAG: hypothetical protein R3C44_17495 [Chloroflexota bacterium]
MCPQTSKLVIIVANGPDAIAIVPATWVGTLTGSRSPLRASLVAIRSAKLMRHSSYALDRTQQMNQGCDVTRPHVEQRPLPVLIERKRLDSQPSGPCPNINAVYATGAPMAPSSISLQQVCNPPPGKYQARSRHERPGPTLRKGWPGRQRG